MADRAKDPLWRQSNRRAQSCQRTTVSRSLGDVHDDLWVRKWFQFDVARAIRGVHQRQWTRKIVEEETVVAPGDVHSHLVRLGSPLRGHVPRVGIHWIVRR